jgi:hypothetical protein
VGFSAQGRRWFWRTILVLGYQLGAKANFNDDTNISVVCIRFHNVVAVDSTPGGNVLFDARVACYDEQGFAGMHGFDFVLCFDDRHGTE